MVSAELLGLEGVETDAVERSLDGQWTVHVRSAAGQQAGCTGCGRVAGRVKEPVLHTLKHLVLVPVRVLWHKHRFWCDNDGCPTVTFAESGPMAGPGGCRRTPRR
jgi:transposase